MNTQQPEALRPRTTVEYAEWLADKLHNTNDYGKEAAFLLVQHATELTVLRARVEKAEAEWAALSQDDGKAQREIERLRSMVEAAEAALIAPMRHISIPTETMEYEFARHYDRGYKAGKAAAGAATIPTELIERDYAWHYDRGYSAGLKAAASKPEAFSCRDEVAGGEPCKKWCGDQNACLAVVKPDAESAEAKVAAVQAWPVGEALRPVCRYISGVLNSDAQEIEKIVARTVMLLLPLEDALAAPQPEPR